MTAAAAVQTGPVETLAPSGPKPRVQTLDVIRGLAVLGILAVNADGFAAPMFGALNPATWPFPNEGATALSYWWGLRLFGRVENLLDERYQEVFGFEAAPITAFAGIKLTFGGPDGIGGAGVK